MPDISLNGIRERLRAMEPEMRVSLVELITQHRSDLRPEALNTFSTHQLMKLAESCVPGGRRALDYDNLPRMARLAHQEEVRKKRAARVRAEMEAARERLNRTFGPRCEHRPDPSADTAEPFFNVLDLCDSDEARRKRRRDRLRKERVLRLVPKPSTSDANDEAN